MKTRRVDIRTILNTPLLRQRMMVGAIKALQAREGIDTTDEQALDAYRKVFKTERVYAKGQ